MGSWIELTAADGHALAAYEARPDGPSRGGVVVVQEIFGVTAHIRDVTDGFAAAGFHAVAPAVFDRIERNVNLPYSDVAGGRERVGKLSRDDIVADLGAAVAWLAPGGRVGVVGYCWGGSAAWIAAATLPLAAAVSYYGTRIADNLDLVPACPMQFHLGERDAGIPPERVAAFKAACPTGEFYLYPAGHGFNCTDRADYDAASARLALERTLAFFHRHLG